jgi:hypothetical protein
MLVDIYSRYELGYEQLWQAFQKIGVGIATGMRITETRWGGDVRNQLD